MSQKQISEILGIGTSFISQIETGKDPMPGYIPDKLAEAFGKEAVEHYYHETFLSDAEAERFGLKKFLHPSAGFFPTRKQVLESGEPLDPATAAEEAKRANDELIERVLYALERRDELLFQQQREHERQGARIDELLAILRSRA